MSSSNSRSLVPSNSRSLVPSNTGSRSVSSTAGPSLADGYTYEYASMERVRHRDGSTTESAQRFRTDGKTADYEYKTRTTGGSGLPAIPAAPSTAALEARMSALGLGEPGARLAAYDADAYDRSHYPSRAPSSSRRLEPSLRQQAMDRAHHSAMGRSASHREPSRSHSQAARERQHTLPGAGFSSTSRSGSGMSRSSSLRDSEVTVRAPSSSHRSPHVPSSSHHHGSHVPSSSSHRSSHVPSSSHHHGSSSHHDPHRPSRSSSRSGETRHIEASGTTRVVSRVPTQL